MVRELHDLDETLWYNLENPTELAKKEVGGA